MPCRNVAIWGARQSAQKGPHTANGVRAQGLRCDLLQVELEILRDGLGEHAQAGAALDAGDGLA